MLGPVRRGYWPGMPTVERTFTVTPPPATVLEYLKDFTHTNEWDPGTDQTTRNGSGPVEVGSTWHNKSTIVGISTELEYTLTEISDSRLVFVGRNDTATTTDTITVVPDGTGSQLTYHVDLDMHGMAALASPAVKLVFEKVASDTEKQLTEVLNRLA